MNPYTAQRIAEADTYAPQTGPLAATNRGFHESYNTLLGDTLDQLGHSIPVIVMLHDDLLLVAGDTQQQARVVPEHYHRLKAIAHSGFGLQLWLMAHRSRVLDDKMRVQLVATATVLRNSLTALDSLPPDERPTPKTLLEGNLEYIDRVLTAGVAEIPVAQEYAEWIAPHVLNMARAAVRLELDSLHEVVGRWRGELGKEAWQHIYVVLCGNHQPRYRQAANQYFDRLLGEHPGIGAESEDRIVFAENVSELDGALDLLARHIIDQQASTMIFGYRSRLQKDILADAATEYLDRLLPGRE